jgi:hypothetical protein
MYAYIPRCIIITGGWSHYLYTDISEPFVGYGVNNMVHENPGIRTSNLLVTERRRGEERRGEERREEKRREEKRGEEKRREEKRGEEKRTGVCRFAIGTLFIILAGFGGELRLQTDHCMARLDSKNKLCSGKGVRPS